ncbi:hypothetical protein K470DRAFT_106196 [Piedraia hortae CBS 480.64]|uniref:SAM and PH domain-containing protein n=1 Tax=Piedraia hortae CBS 480.64 TaxID=1314780 RepID=A0A6A7C8B5_9PEZI|nr:hypothetical protein K470DRAFT_106196 [Piedraia hortae CBS 480.64]
MTDTVNDRHFFEAQSVKELARPLTIATSFNLSPSEATDTEFEDSEDEDSTCGRRTSQTTLSSYDEAPTPRSCASPAFYLPVQGPKGPHLFRSDSRSSSDHALQMSPILSMSPLAPPSPGAARADYDLGEVRNWAPHQVIEWAESVGLDQSIVNSLTYHDVDGRVLLDLHFDDLRELDITSFGKRHRLWSAICDIKGEPPMSPAKKRRNRKVNDSPVTETIVAIEQLAPKPHDCPKGERCAKWRRQQRQLRQLQEDNAIGRYSVSPTRLQVEPPLPTGVPSVIASSAALTPRHLPKISLQAEALQYLDERDPQENVRQFLQFQHVPEPPARSASVPPLFPEQHHNPYPALRSSLRAHPKLEISPLAGDAPASPESATAPRQIPRFATPASEVDVPTTSVFPPGPIERETSASAPPSIQRPLMRTFSRTERRRPSFGSLPAVAENEVLGPITNTTLPTVPEHSKYGADCSRAGWMKKRRTRLLRHEWREAHFRLRGSQLRMYASDQLNAPENESINVDEYTVACTTAAAGKKLAAAMKAFHLNNNSNNSNGKNTDGTAFAFDLVPRSAAKTAALTTMKTHHFAVKNKDDRIEWMRELMLAKARRQKGEGYEVKVNGLCV